MELVSQLVASYFPGSRATLCLDGQPVDALADKYGTPLFVYHAGILGQKWNRLREALPPEFSICYSVKANPHRAFLEYFLAKGCGLEIASVGELHQALGASCTPGEILFAGPGKTEAELKTALTKGVGEIHAESTLELERISALARRLNVRARVAVRVNPGSEAEGGAMRMGGKPAPFGVDEENLDGVIDRIISDAALEFRGLHFYAGTQILDYAVLARQYRKGIDIARRLAGRLSKPLTTVDFGGGLGIPYFSHDEELDMPSLRRELGALIQEVRKDPLFAGTRYLVEPGRYLVGEAGVYITRVVDIKVSRGKKFLVVDGGMNHHLAASGNLGQTIKRNYPVALLEKLDAHGEETVDVVGPLCTPLDVLARAISLPQAEVGDLIGVFQSGAYARSASPLGFLSHPTPPEVWVENGQELLIRARGKPEDYSFDICSPVQMRA